MSQAIDLLNDIVSEELPRMFIDLEPKVAPQFERVKRTSMGVKSQDGLGKGFKVIHMYETGTAGLFESGDPLGPGMTSMSGNQAQILAEGTAASNLSIFPSASEVPHTGEVKRELVLHKVVGNYSCPAAWKQLDMLSAAQLKKVARDMKAVAKAKLLYESTSFHSYEVTNDAGYVNQVLGRISAIAEHSVWTDYITITVNEEYGRIANFAKGQRLDLVADSSGTLQSGTAADGSDVRNYTHTGQVYVHLIVVDVDYLGKKITLRPINSTTGALPNYGSGTSGDVFQAANPAAADDWIVYSRTSRYISGSRPQYSWGIENWVKSSGQILGGADQASGLDLDLYTMFKSHVKAVNASLTDNIINGYVGGWLDAYPGEELDTIITTQGVQQHWLTQPTVQQQAELRAHRKSSEFPGRLVEDQLRVRRSGVRVDYESDVPVQAIVRHEVQRQ
ncbi:MAG: hypothetical protein ACYTEX_28165 [Planctomycetota bacterium]|jgi:hypothetical protein